MKLTRAGTVRGKFGTLSRRKTTSSSPESSKSGKIRDSFYWILVSVDFQINDTFPLPDLICS